MKSILRSVVIQSILLSGSFLFWSTAVLAQTTPVNPGGSNTPVNPGNDSLRLQNPLGNTDIIKFLQSLLDVIMIFAIPLIVFMIIYAGFNYVMAQGNPGKIKDANRALLYALIGGVLIIGANIILAVVQGTVDAFRV